MMTRARTFLASDLPRPLLIAGALIPIVAALAGAARWVKTSADNTYVRRDTFAAFQAGEALTRQADSLNAAEQTRDVMRLLMGLDSSDRCRRGQSGFCR